MTVIDKDREDSMPLDITLVVTNSCLQSIGREKDPNANRESEKGGDEVIAASPHICKPPSMWYLGAQP